MPNLDARPVCLVTGAARRIGAAIATELASTFDVAIHFRASDRDAAALAGSLREAGARVELFRADLSIDEEAASLVRDVAKTFGRLDLVVNNASVFSYDTPSVFDAAAMRDMIAVNLVAPVVIAREFAQVGSERALLVNMLDNKVFALNPDFFSYTLGKVALKGAIDMLAMHFRGRMRVCGIAPGVTMVSGDQSEENFEKSWRHTLSGRGATPQEIASTVRYLWSTPSVNAEIIVLDGGQRLLSLDRDVAFVVE